MRCGCYGKKEVLSAVASRINGLVLLPGEVDRSRQHNVIRRRHTVVRINQCLIVSGNRRVWRDLCDHCFWQSNSPLDVSLQDPPMCSFSTRRMGHEAGTATKRGGCGHSRHLPRLTTPSAAVLRRMESAARCSMDLSSPCAAFPSTRYFGH